MNFRQMMSVSVVLVSSKDSVITDFGRTNYAGVFALHVPQKGKYHFRASYPGFADYSDELNITGDSANLGKIAMLSREHLLKEFVITKQIAAIKIKGDTTEYVADSFKTKANASVQDLLKKLPGIQVDKDGKITAQGETVNKVLVDGEEFFSDDPKVVTQGLQAVAVDKVQVFDKKSEQAEFTGIDDGQKSKTINLELKENAKKGYFGKLDAGGGTDGYYQEQGMINAFKGKRQLSAFGITSNTDKAGLGWNENDKFGGSSGNTVISDDGSSYTFYSNAGDFSNWDGKYNGEGLPKTSTGGVHYADKWDEDKNHISGNYRYGAQSVNIEGGTTTQYILPGNKGSLQKENKTQSSLNYRHGADGFFEKKIDTNTTVKLTVDAGLKHSQINSYFLDSTLNDENSFVNANLRNMSSTTDAQYMNSSLSFKRKFAKKGRTLSVDVKENYNNSTSLGTLNSSLVYQDSVTKKDTFTFTNQEKDNNSRKTAFSFKAVYTEPLSKKFFLDINLQSTVNNSFANNASYDLKNGMVSKVMDSMYSSNFKYHILNNRGGFSLKYDFEKIKFNFGSDFTVTRYLHENVLDSNRRLIKYYYNAFPSAGFVYKLKKQTSFYFNYNGSSRQPTIEEVAPLKQNNNPLNVMIGNPNLKQSFSHRLSLSFNDYKVLSNKYTYCNVSFNTTEDAISARQTISAMGNQTQYINTNGNYSWDYYLSQGAKIKKTNLYLSLHTSGDFNHNNNFVNNVANTSDNNSYTVGSYISYEKENKFSFELDPQYTYNDNKATISSFANSYYMFKCEFSTSVQITKKLDINTSVEYITREKTAVFNQNKDVIRWNAYIAQKLLKGDRMEVRLSVFDILNQNIGYQRTANDGIVTANSYNTIKRYGMLNVIWNFNSNPATGAEKDNDD